MKQFFDSDFEGKVAADDFSGVVLCVGVFLFLLRCQLCALMKLTFLSELFDFLLVNLFGLFVQFVFLFLFFLILFNESPVLFFADNALFGLLGALVGNQIHVHFLFILKAKFYSKLL